MIISSIFIFLETKKLYKNKEYIAFLTWVQEKGSCNFFFFLIGHKIFKDKNKKIKVQTFLILFFLMIQLR